MAITYGSISGAEPSTVTFQVQTVVINQNSTNVQREVLVFGDPESSLGLARVLAASPASTEYGVVVRQVGHSTTVNVSSVAGAVIVRSSAADFGATVTQASTVWAVQHSGPIIVRSSAADNLGTVYQSSAADLNVTVAGYVAPSTTVAVSTVAGRVAIAGFHAVAGIVNVTDSTNNAINVNVVAGSAASTLVTVRQSSAADLNVTVAGYVAPSTIVSVSTLAGRVGMGAWHAGGTVINVADSTNNAINVNVVAGAAGGSTLVTVRQSTAADLQATVAPASTVWAVQLTQYSSNAGAIRTYGGATVLALSSTGLTNGSARQSDVVDNGTNRFSDIILRFTRKGTAASSGLLDYYIYSGVGTDTVYTDRATGADATFASTNRRNSRYLGSLQLSTAPDQERAIFQLSDIFRTLPRKWGVIEINNSAGTISSTNTDVVTEWEGIY